MIHTNGYVIIKAPENYKGKMLRRGYVYEHQLVLEKKLGRLLRKNEISHHLNGDRQDNREENLILSNRSEHARNHQYAKGIKTVKLKCPSCEKIFEKRIGQTHLIKGGKFTACSRSCVGKITGKNRKEIPELEKRIKENILKIYRKIMVKVV